MLERTNQELSASRAHDLLQDTENAAALPPINPLGGTVFLYYNPGKEGEHPELRRSARISRTHVIKQSPVWNIIQFSSLRNDMHDTTSQ